MLAFSTATVVQMPESWFCACWPYFVFFIAIIWYPIEISTNMMGFGADSDSTNNGSTLFFIMCIFDLVLRLYLINLVDSRANSLKETYEKFIVNGDKRFYHSVYRKLDTTSITNLNLGEPETKLELANNSSSTSTSNSNSNSVDDINHQMALKHKHKKHFSTRKYETIKKAVYKKVMGLIKFTKKTFVLATMSYIIGFIAFVTCGLFSIMTIGLCIDSWLNILCLLYCFKMYKKEYDMFCGCIDNTLMRNSSGIFHKILIARRDIAASDESFNATTDEMIAVTINTQKNSSHIHRSNHLKKNIAGGGGVTLTSQVVSGHRMADGGAGSGGFGGGVYHGSFDSLSVTGTETAAFGSLQLHLGLNSRNLGSSVASTISNKSNAGNKVCKNTKEIKERKNSGNKIKSKSKTNQSKESKDRKDSKDSKDSPESNESRTTPLQQRTLSRDVSSQESTAPMHAHTTSEGRSHSQSVPSLNTASIIAPSDPGTRSRKTVGHSVHFPTATLTATATTAGGVSIENYEHYNFSSNFNTLHQGSSEVTITEMDGFAPTKRIKRERNDSQVSSIADSLGLMRYDSDTAVTQVIYNQPQNRDNRKNRANSAKLRSKSQGTNIRSDSDIIAPEEQHENNQNKNKSKHMATSSVIVHPSGPSGIDIVFDGNNLTEEKLATNYGRNRPETDGSESDLTSLSDNVDILLDDGQKMELNGEIGNADNINMNDSANGTDDDSENTDTKNQKHINITLQTVRHEENDDNDADDEKGDDGIGADLDVYDEEDDDDDYVDVGYGSLDTEHLRHLFHSSSLTLGSNNSTQQSITAPITPEMYEAKIAQAYALEIEERRPVSKSVGIQHFKRKTGSLNSKAKIVSSPNRNVDNNRARRGRGSGRNGSGIRGGGGRGRRGRGGYRMRGTGRGRGRGRVRGNGYGRDRSMSSFGIKKTGIKRPSSARNLSRTNGFALDPRASAPSGDEREFEDIATREGHGVRGRGNNKGRGRGRGSQRGRGRGRGRGRRGGRGGRGNGRGRGGGRGRGTGKGKKKGRVRFADAVNVKQSSHPHPHRPARPGARAGARAAARAGTTPGSRANSRPNSRPGSARNLHNDFDNSDRMFEIHPPVASVAEQKGGQIIEKRKGQRTGIPRNIEIPHGNGHRSRAQKERLRRRREKEEALLSREGPSYSPVTRAKANTAIHNMSKIKTSGSMKYQSMTGQNVNVIQYSKSSESSPQNNNRSQSVIQTNNANVVFPLKSTVVKHQPE